MSPSNPQGYFGKQNIHFEGILYFCTRIKLMCARNCTRWKMRGAHKRLESPTPNCKAPASKCKETNVGGQHFCNIKRSPRSIPFCSGQVIVEVVDLVQLMIQQQVFANSLKQERLTSLDAAKEPLSFFGVYLCFVLCTLNSDW